MWQAWQSVDSIVTMFPCAAPFRLVCVHTVSGLQASAREAVLSADEFDLRPT